MPSWHNVIIWKVVHKWVVLVASSAFVATKTNLLAGKHPSPLLHDSIMQHMMYAVACNRIEQPQLCVRSMGLGCCPTSIFVELAIHRHCLLRPRQGNLINEEPVNLKTVQQKTNQAIACDSECVHHFRSLHLGSAIDLKRKKCNIVTDRPADKSSW